MGEIREALPPESPAGAAMGSGGVRAQPRREWASASTATSAAAALATELPVS